MLIDRDTILRAKEELGDRNADIIQNLLHMEKYNEQRRVGCCPSPDHADKTPSCSYNSKTYAFHCFGCGYTVDIISAYMTAENLSFTDACRKVFEEANIPFDFSAIGTSQRKRDYRYPHPRYANTKERVYAYAKRRGISQETIDYLGIAEDIRGNVIFQYFDFDGTLVSAKYRKTAPHIAGEPKVWFDKNVDHMDILYNIGRITPELPLIITCGEFDCASAIECGFVNAVSINGGDSNTRWIAECWDWLEQFQEIILVPDNDESGRKFTKEVSTRLGEYRVKIVDLSPYVYEQPGKNPRQIGDLNELLYFFGKEAVRDAIETAKATEIPSIVDYTDIKRFDMSDVSGFKSGFAELDDALDKFYMGSTTVLTGIPGSGKSSLLSTLICRSADQGFPVFVYSGELSNPSLKNWVDFVHAGRRGLIEIPKPDGKGAYYKINQIAFNKINEYYRGQIYFYKDDFDQKASSILNAAEGVVRRYGVKTLMFDNMTSVDLENSDDNKWQKQEDFIRSIIAFAKRWDVCCIVVIHPKKMDTTRRMSLYDLSGVSASANMAMRVLSLYRFNDAEKQNTSIPHDIAIDVLKDRYGSGGGRSINLYYDIPSRRFYDNMLTLDHKYSWDANSNYAGVPIPFGEPVIQDDTEVYGEVIKEQPHGK